MSYSEEEKISFNSVNSSYEDYLNPPEFIISQNSQLDPQAQNFSSQKIQLYTFSQLKEYQTSQIDCLSSKYGISETKAFQILLEKNWNFDLADNFFSDDYEFPPIENLDKNLSDKENIPCPICYQIISLSESFSLECNHFICFSCFKNYVLICFNEGPKCILTNCPFGNCSEIVGPNVFYKFLKINQKELYDKYLIDCMINKSINFKWCSGSNCNIAFYLKGIKKEVK